MRLHVIYRSIGADNRKGRPAWFDKRLALASLIRASIVAGDVDLTFVNDGPLPEDRAELVWRHGQVIELDSKGNSGSYRAAMNLAVDSSWSDDDLVYLCEDDYLHAPEALRSLLHAAEQLPSAAYFSLYDHPDLYRLRRRRPAIRVAAGYHWQEAPSICMTFGARLGALRRDRWIHWAGTIPRTPRDQRIWQVTLRTGPFSLLPRRRSGHLMSVLPSLATHAEAGQLAPVVPWDSLAEQTRARDDDEWAGGISRGRP